MGRQLEENIDFRQPDFYHFSEDSLWLIQNVRMIVHELTEFKKNKPYNCLDLCAGCGILGIELMRLFPNFIFNFCELQDEFKDLIKYNIQLYIEKERLAQSKTFIMSYQNFARLHNNEKEKETNLNFQRDAKTGGFEKYDLIVSNPPFFDNDCGRLSPSNHKKNLCRFFLQESRAGFLISLGNLLKTQGKAFFLGRLDCFTLSQWQELACRSLPNSYIILRAQEGRRGLFELGYEF